jgi:UPF0716 protein FxsA
MRLIIALILLAFPFVEIALLIQLFQRYGWWVLVYLVVIGYLGLQLIVAEKALIATRMVQSFGAGFNPIKTLMGTARNMLAGVLLIIPGVITDAIAVILLLYPSGHPSIKQTKTRPSANDDVIEGEFEHVDEPKKPNTRLPNNEDKPN